jgi:hypothetical protein
VRYQEERTKLYTTQYGVPQGSILGLILYSIVTADLPETEQTRTATYFDDTTIPVSHQIPSLHQENFKIILIGVKNG